MKTFTCIITLALVALLSQSCNQLSTPPDPAKIQSILQIPAYQEVRIAPKPILIKWDFNRTPSTLFTYHQKTASTNQTNIGTDHSKTATAIDATGLINVRKTKKEGNLVVIQNERSKLTNWTPNLDKPLSNVSRAPLAILKGLKSNGTFSPALSPHQAAWGYIFHLPNRPLKTGQTIQWPVNFPLQEGKKELIAKGKTLLTLTRIVKISGKVCAQLNLKQSAKYYNRSQADGTFSYSSEVNTTLFFNILSGTMHSAYMDMQIITNKNNPNTTIQAPGSLPAQGLKVTTHGHTMLKIIPYNKKQPINQ